MGALKLITEARSAGLKLRAEGGRLVIRGPRSAEPIAKALLDRKAEVLPFLRESLGSREEKPDAATWPCPRCGHPASVEDVDWSLDGERRLTFWSCNRCQVVAVTPSDVREPPSAWVRKVR